MHGRRTEEARALHSNCIGRSDLKDVPGVAKISSPGRPIRADATLAAEVETFLRTQLASGEVSLDDFYTEIHVRAQRHVGLLNLSPRLRNRSPNGCLCLAFLEVLLSLSLRWGNCVSSGVFLALALSFGNGAHRILFVQDGIVSFLTV